MGRIAFLFPGQASQAVGMQAHLEDYPEAAEFLDKTYEFSGLHDLTSIISQGPPEKLTQTNYAQPAITMVSIATLRILQVAGIQPEGTAGHSLGEYSALVAAGILMPETAVRLTRIRGELMQKCADMYPGGMQAILGMDLDKVTEIVNEASAKGPVGVANMNSTGQVVISGAKAPLEYAGKLCAEQGARRVIPLKVSGAWHSPLMEDAARGLEDPVREAAFFDPGIPVVANVTANYITGVEESRELLIRQVTSPVLWADSMKLMVENGFDTFVEVGPGRVLQGLLARNRDVTVYGTHDADALKKTLDELT
ncbi:MAG: [acyl-carrier-protein] S-malonyltransferase [Gemmatimonadaceae bacterium 4484_173]|nr:MAG: [acyl-carrier-protein] S-malonyltransferase [Gemmatimonadaceae bacterium 4484_173]RKZ04071.1 MAG: [acyl-carrier-protein] S-malonyltransferase [Candidatus Fermentibacteria bacterium]